MMRLGVGLFVVVLLSAASMASAETYRFGLPCVPSDLIPAKHAERLLILCKDKSVLLVATPSGRVVRTISKARTWPQKTKLDAAAVSGDGSTVALSFFDGTLFVLTDNPSEPARILKTETYVNNLRFAPDARSIFADHRRIELGPSLRVTGSLPTSFDSVNDVAFSLDGGALVSVAADTSVTVFSFPDLRPLEAYSALTVEPFTAAYSTDGHLVVGVADGRMLIFNRSVGALQDTVISPPKTSIGGLYPVSATQMLVKYRPWIGGDSAFGVLDLKRSTFKPLSSVGKIDAVAQREGVIWLYDTEGREVQASSWVPN